MPRKLYVTNLSPAVPRDEVERLFAVHGAIRSVAVIDQFKTADRTCVAFVEMNLERDGGAAIAALDGTPHRGSTLSVTWAVPGQRQGIDLSRIFEPTAGRDRTEGGAGRDQPLARRVRARQRARRKSRPALIGRARPLW